MPGGTQLCLGALVEDRLLGVLTLGVGPTNAHRLFENAAPFDCVTLNVAKMEQKDSKSQAVHVAARRAKANGIVKIQDINGKLVGTPFEQATERASLNWSLQTWPTGKDDRRGRDDP